MQTILTLTADADSSVVAAHLKALGQWASASGTAGGHRAYAVSAASAHLDDGTLEAVPGVATVLRPASPHPLLDARAGQAVPVGRGLRVGPGAPPVLMAGPCAVESQAQLNEAAAMASAAGATLLRGGAYKPRSSPYSFTGHGVAGLRWLRQAADAHEMAVVTEALSELTVDEVASYADLIQVGSRNMQNFALLKAIGATGKPALLKRGAAATLLEWRLAAEHLLAAGAAGVILCERGLAGTDPELRNTLDLAGALAQRVSWGVPVIVDPSHATGRRDLVVPLAQAALAAGLDGVMVEAHPDPGAALSDGPQALDTTALNRVGDAVRAARRTS